MSRIIEMETVLTVESSGGIPLKALWRYNTNDPWAVELSIEDQESTVTWSFSRDLLDVGLISGEAMGAGDIRIWSCQHDELHMWLSNPTGQASLTLDSGDAIEFIDTTYEAVPEGEEELFVNLDAEIAGLLGEAA